MRADLEKQRTKIQKDLDEANERGDQAAVEKYRTSLNNITSRIAELGTATANEAVIEVIDILSDTNISEELLSEVVDVLREAIVEERRNSFKNKYIELSHKKA